VIPKVSKDRLELLDAIEDFQREELSEAVDLGNLGVSPYRMFVGRGDRLRRMELAWCAKNRSTLEQALRRRVTAHSAGMLQRGG
jgi:hypothetical protein